MTIKCVFFLFIMFLEMLAPTMANASDDEAATGVFSYKSKNLNIRFILDLDGVRDLAINGQLHAGPIKLSEAPGSGEEKSYTFYAVDKGTAEIVTLVVLFDTTGAVRAVLGFYFEHPEGSERMDHVITFQPKFRRLMPDSLPSSKLSK